jgi:hypothetical protein
MFSTLRTRFGIPGVISVMALVFAMFGGAYAASNSSDNGKATASAKAKKGPRGPKGATGPAGPSGPQGPAGQTGAAGPKGDAGAAGASGANGQSVTVGSVSVAGEEGKCVGTGGAKFTAGAAKAFACNGEEGLEGPAGANGAPGPEGSPWVDGGTLPPGESETGTWAVGQTGVDPSKLEPPATGILVNSPISFPIPLAAAGELAEEEAVLNEIPVTYLTKADSPTAGCPGTVEEPAAAPGNLCVYAVSNFEVDYIGERNPENNQGSAGTGKAGVILIFNVKTELASARGTWVLTAQTE